MKEIKTSFQLCYEALKLSCAVWPEGKGREADYGRRYYRADAAWWRSGLVGWRWC